MDVLFDRVAGLDIGKASVTVCVRTPAEGGGRRSQTRTFNTMTRTLEVLADWLVAEGVTLAAMESTATYSETGVGLPGGTDGVLAAQRQPHESCPGPQVRRQGRGVDRAAARARPGPAVARAATRHPPVTEPDPLPGPADGRPHPGRHPVGQAASDASIKLSVVASNITGVSSRKMLGALVAGERDPAVMAQLAMSRMRRKIPDLVEALTGHFDDHHSLLVG